MTILAKAVKGHEWMFTTASAHKVSKASAKVIRDALNGIKYDLKDGETWWIYEDVSEWENAGIYASVQAFKRYKGNIRRVYS